MSAKDLIAQSIVWESVVGWTPECLDNGPEMLTRFDKAGFSFVSLTIGADWDKPEATLKHFAQQRRWIERQQRYRIIETADDIVAAKADGQMAVSFHLQVAGPLGYEPAL